MAAEQHSLNFDGKLLTLHGVKQVSEISDKQAVFKLEGKVLTVKGSGLNVVKLDKAESNVALEVGALSSLGYRASGLTFKGLFR